MAAHTLGNPFNLGAVLEFCRKYDLYLIEDNCDALGSSYSMPAEMAKSHGFKTDDPSDVLCTRPTGAWGDLSTQSFYPPHHLTMGEGGVVNIIRSIKLHRIAMSFRIGGGTAGAQVGRMTHVVNGFLGVWEIYLRATTTSTFILIWVII